MNQRLIHDATYAISIQILQTIATCLREEEQRDAFAEFYRIVKEGLESYEIKIDRMQSRLRGSGSN